MIKQIAVYLFYSISIILLLHQDVEAQISGIKLAEDPCTNITLTMQAEGTSSSPYFFWNFDDPASGVNDTATFTGLSSPPFPTHTFTAPGIYNVCVSFQEPGEAISTVCRKIPVQFCCQGIISSTDTCLEKTIAFNLSSSASVSAISWNFGDPASGAANTNSALAPTHKFSGTGTFSVTANITADCGAFTSTYLQKIIRCTTGSSNCTGTILSSDTCLGKNVGFSIQSDKTVNLVDWKFGDPLSGANNETTGKASTHRFSGIGNYTVRAIVTFDCGIDTLYRVVRSVNCDSSIVPLPADSNCKLNFPNAFTPNNDNINDRFGSQSTCVAPQYELIILNRWGQVVFRATDQNNKWDGLFNGKEAEMGTYYYTVKFSFRDKEEKRQSGDVILLR